MGRRQSLLISALSAGQGWEQGRLEKSIAVALQRVVLLQRRYSVFELNSLPLKCRVRTLEESAPGFEGRRPRYGHSAVL